CRAGSVMRGLRGVARISGAKGADLRGICAMKGGLRLAQSILPQPFEQIGIFRRFSRRSKADSEAREKPDSRALFRVENDRILPCVGACSEAQEPRNRRWVQ